MKNGTPLVALQRDLQQQLEPAVDRVSGPSFPVTLKILATGLIVALVVAGAAVMLGSSGRDAARLSFGQWGFLLAVVAVIASGYWGILTSQTSCDSQCIEQTWLWCKRVNIAEITQLKLVALPGLNGLVVPRLVVRTGYGLTTFHAGDPDVYARFKLLAHGR
jgi:hypothetical protein